MSWTKRYLSFFIVIFSILFAILLAEISLRILGIGYGNSPIEASEVLHHVHPKNYKYRAHDPAGEYGNFDVVYDEFRYRVSGEKIEKLLNGEQRKIYFLGDSFTEAVQVGWADSFVGKIGSTHQKTYVRNMGVSSYSPLFYLIQLKTELANVRNADVVLQLYENDFDSDSGMRHKANSEDIRKIESINGEGASLIIQLLRYSYVARLVRKVQLQIAYLMNPSSQAVSFQKDREPDNHRKQSAEKREFSYKILNEIKEFCDTRLLKLHVMIIPNKTLARSNESGDQDWLHEEVKVFAKTNKISFIDLAKEFQKISNQKDLFFPVDIHLTIAGHDIVYRIIEEHLYLKN